MKKIFLLGLLGLAVIFATGKVFAKQNLIEASGSYVMDMSLDETPASATARAREEAKRAAIEKAGVYIQTYSKTVDLVLDHDEIRTVAARLLQIQDEKITNSILNDNLIQITVKIQALVDDKNPDVLKAIMQDKENLEESTRKYQELQKEYDALKRQMEEIKRQYKTSNASVDELKKAVAQNTEKFNANQELEAANNFYQRGEYQKALAAYNRAASLNPTSAEILNNRGLTYYHLNQLDRALEDFNMAVDLNSLFLHAYNNRGIVRYETGRADLAIQDYTAALKLNPKFAYALNNRGNAYAAAGQLQNAVQDLQAAAEILRENAEVHNNLGSVYFLLARYDSAINEYTRAIQLKPDYAEAFYNRGLVYAQLGKFNEALADAKRAKDLNTADVDAQDLYDRISSR